jgi:hypothetical protein
MKRWSNGNSKLLPPISNKASTNEPNSQIIDLKRKPHFPLSSKFAWSIVTHKSFKNAKMKHTAKAHWAGGIKE